MAKIIAVYNIKVTLREPEDLAEGEAVMAPPTLAEVEAAVQGAVQNVPPLVAETKGARFFTANATAERTDR